MRYDDFELLVMPKTAEGYPVRVISASAGEAQGILHFDSTYEAIQQALTRIQNQDTDEQLLMNLGRMLFQQLFNGEIENLYRVSLGRARAQGKGLRIRLRLEPSELGAIPWEYLYDELNDLFLGISPETPITRYIPVPEPPRSITIHPTLRVLVVISNPVDLGEWGMAELDAEREKQVLKDALEEWEKEGLVQLEFLDHAIASEIREKLRRYQPHVFHFIGHGTFQNEQGYLVIEDDDCRLRVINDRTFREFFLGSDCTKLVILNACQSATSSSTQPLVGLAPGLVRRGLPAVVAMQYSIHDETAIRFSREFYRALALGLPVDTAISEARRGIFIDCGAERRDWGTPVLFMRSPDGVILKLARPITRAVRLESIPGNVNFIGRQKELKEYQRKLDSQNIVVIGGTAGVGKTMLGAQLVALQSQRKAFWHTFHKGLNDNLESVIWALGEFLAANEDHTLQRFLDLNIETLEEGYKVNEAINLLIYSLEQGSYLLCFDDFQVADEDEKLNSLFQIFSGRLQNTKVIVMSRSRPRFADVLGLDYKPLSGLTEGDAEALLQKADIHLSTELFDKLYAQTQGNPKLLELFITWMESKNWTNNEISNFINGAFGERVEEYLVRNVYETLSPEEQRVLKAISIFRSPIDEEAIGEILAEEGMEDVDRVLDALVRKYVVQQSDYGEKYLHSLLEEFCCDRLRTDSSFRTRLHKNAGRYYYDMEDYLEAAYHYFEAKEYRKSATTITDNLEQLLFAGQSTAILGQLSKLNPQMLDPATWASVCIAKGDACMIVGKYDDAIANYQAALNIASFRLNPRKASDVQRKIGEGYDRKGLYDKALEHYLAGIQALNDDVSVGMARIYGRLSRIYAHQGEYEKAIESARQGLRIAKGMGQEKEIADCYDAIGLIYLQKGDYDRAIEHHSKALEARERSGDKLGLAGSYIKLGIAYKSKGDYNTALEYYTKGLTASHEMNDIIRIAVSHGELGFVQDLKGNYEQAIWHYKRALPLFQRLGNKRLEAITHNNLGEVYRGKGEYGQAMEHLYLALKMYTDLEDTEGLSDAYRILSEISLQLGNPHQAEQYCQRAIQLATEIGSKYCLGCAFRSLGNIQATTENFEEARENLNSALAIFQELGDEGEITYTLSDIARLEHKAGNSQRAMETCTEALKMAERLGIERVAEQMAELKRKLS